MFTIYTKEQIAQQIEAAKKSLEVAKMVKAMANNGDYGC